MWTTPFHPRTAALNQLNLWHRWRDYTVADAYFDVGMEYNAIRNSCAVFDLSPMTKHLITGPDALAYMNRLVTRDVAKIKPGRVGYCLWCDDAGQVVDDGTIFHLRDNVYRLCSQERQLDWLLTSKLGFDVNMVEETNEVAGARGAGADQLRGAQGAGPRRHRDADAVRHAHLSIRRRGADWSRAPATPATSAMSCGSIRSAALPLWDGLFAAGSDHGIRAIGTLALEMSRIEAGFIQAGVDFLPADRAVRVDRTRSPFELDLGRLVDFSKPNFTGRRALLAEQQRGSRYRLVRLDVEGNKTAKDAYVYDSRAQAHRRRSTSAMWSPAAKASIALATVEMPWGRPDDELYAEIYYQKELKWSRFMARCRVVAGAFYDPARRRLTPAPGSLRHQHASGSR